MAKCIVCGGNINEGGKDDIGICFMCETEKVKGEVVIAEVGAFKRLTGRTFIVTNEGLQKVHPGHTIDDRMYLMPKKQFKINLAAFTASKMVMAGA